MCKHFVGLLLIKYRYIGATQLTEAHHLMVIYHYHYHDDCHALGEGLDCA